MVKKRRKNEDMKLQPQNLQIMVDFLNLHFQLIQNSNNICDYRDANANKIVNDGYHIFCKFENTTIYNMEQKVINIY